MRPGFRLSAFLPALGWCLLAGCGGTKFPPTLPVEGVVLLDDRPVAEAAVMFVPAAGGNPALGATDASGKFRLTTYRQNDGAAPGPHKITVQKNKIVGAAADAAGLEAAPGSGPPKIEWIVPEKYSKANESGLTVEVTRGMPAVTLNLSSKP